MIWFFLLIDLMVGVNFGSAMSNISTQIISMMAEDTRVQPFNPADPIVTSLLSVSMLIGSMAGSLGVSFFVAQYGRKSVSVVCGVSAAILNSLQFIPVNWWYVFVVRILFGVFSASLNTIIPVWLSQMISDNQRAIITVGFQTFACFGQVISALILLAIGSNSSLWLLSFIPSTVCPLITTLCCLKLADEKNIETQSSNISWKRFFYSKKYRKICLNSILLPFAQQATGSNAVIIYATKIFQDTFSAAGEVYSPIFGALLISGLNVAFTSFSMVLLLKFGRKTLNLFGYAICIIALAGLITYYLLPVDIRPSTLLIISSLSFISGFAIGPGPILYVLSAELFPKPTTIKASSVNFTTNWTINIIAVVIYPFFTGYEWGAYLTYFILTIIPVMIICFTVPETKGLTLEQINKLLIEAETSDETDQLINEDENQLIG